MAVRPATRLIHHPGSVDEETGAVSTPIYQVSTFRQESLRRKQKYDYSRSGNPTREVLEDYIAELEGVEHGFAFSSGMAAISACMSLLDAGDHLVVTEGLYGGTYWVLTRVFDRFDLEYSFVDTGCPEAVRDAMRDDTEAVFIETPANPTMRITDLAAVSEIAHEHDALAMADSTFMSPWLQRPAESGIDIVIHSATKFLGGHSDLIAGLVALDDGHTASDLTTIQGAMGGIPGPFDSWLLMRGMKTLGVRMDRCQENAREIAHWLQRVEAVDEVLYPGLGTLDGDQAHAEQADGPGAIISFRLREGLSGQRLVESTSVWTLAVSLGAVESIITLPARMTHLPYPREELQRLGIDDRLVRLSVGVEDVRDLIADLENAFQALDSAT